MDLRHSSTVTHILCCRPVGYFSAFLAHRGGGEGGGGVTNICDDVGVFMTKI